MLCIRVEKMARMHLGSHIVALDRLRFIVALDRLRFNSLLFEHPMLRRAHGTHERPVSNEILRVLPTWNQS